VRKGCLLRRLAYGHIVRNSPGSSSSKPVLFETVQTDRLPLRPRELFVNGAMLRGHRTS
jgi:hypothetical protein